MICHALLILMESLPISEQKQKESVRRDEGKVGRRNGRRGGRRNCGQDVKISKFNFRKKTNMFKYSRNTNRAE